MISVASFHRKLVVRSWRKIRHRRKLLLFARVETLFIAGGRRVATVVSDCTEDLTIITSLRGKNSRLSSLGPKERTFMGNGSVAEPESQNQIRRRRGKNFHLSSPKLEERRSVGNRSVVEPE